MQSLMTDQAANLEQTQVVAEPTNPAWIKTELARHPQRPYPMDFIQRIFTDFSEIHGDRAFGDDLAMACGLARFHGEEVMAIGNLKGRGTKEKVRRNFGMPNPEGYRKALRAMKIAEKFHRPVFTFIDLTAAHPGITAEERGQAEAIARNLREMARLRVPTIATITGEGGSGTTSSTQPKRLTSSEVIFRAAAAWARLPASRHMIDPQASGGMTE